MWGCCGRWLRGRTANSLVNPNHSKVFAMYMHLQYGAVHPGQWQFRHFIKIVDFLKFLYFAAIPSMRSPSKTIFVLTRVSGLNPDRSFATR